MTLILNKDFFKRSSTKEGSLCEIYSSSDAGMPDLAILGDDGRQISTWMKCKDFLQDAIWAANTGKPVSIYGFSYDPTIGPTISLSHLILAVRWQKKTAEQMLDYRKNLLATLADIEKTVGIAEPSAISDVFLDERSFPYFVVQGNRAWLKSIGLISFFSATLRLGLVNSVGTFDGLVEMKSASLTSGDIHNLLMARKFVAKLREGIDKIPNEVWADFKSTSSIHNNGMVKWSSAV